MSALGLVSIIIALLVAGAAWVAWSWKQTKELAAKVYHRRVEEGEVSPNVPMEAFQDAYVRAEGPRFSTYVLVAGALSAIAFPVSIYLYSQVWLEVWYLVKAPIWAEQHSLVYFAFMVFFYIAFFFVVAWYTMKRFHLNRPPSLRSEIRRLNGAAE
ncbi:MAG: hypothetical protein AAFX02_04375 [Pseudomonadota bacterium]